MEPFELNCPTGHKSHLDLSFIPYLPAAHASNLVQRSGVPAHKMEEPSGTSDCELRFSSTTLPSVFSMHVSLPGSP